MRPGGGKGKGSAFELEVARQLSLWLTGGADRTQLVRSILSGGWGTTSSRHDGDLAANGLAGERFLEVFVVECKHHHAIDLWGYWSQTGGGRILRWWRKLLLTPSIVAGRRQPFLVVQADRRPPLFGVRGVLTAARLGLGGEAIFPREDLVLASFRCLLEAPVPHFLHVVHDRSEGLA